MDYERLPADILRLNRQLESRFGVESNLIKPMWRVSWSNDQYEKRITDRTDAGIILLTPEVRELPKYQWCKNRWMLENLCVVPDFQQAELAGQKVSYECIWFFEGKDGETILPTLEACEFIITLVESAKGQNTMRKYVDPDASMEAQEKRIQQLMLELFGDESSLEGKTFKGEGIIVPRTYGDTK